MRKNEDAVRDLGQRLANLLGSSLGAYPRLPFHTATMILLPIGNGVVGGLTYALIFGAAALRFNDPTLKWLSLWGACYFIFASIAAEATSSSISKTLQAQILPQLSPAAASAIDGDLQRRFSARRIGFVSTGVALLCTFVSILFIHATASTAKALEIAWWATGYFILYLTAARVTDVSRFYGLFAAHLDKNIDIIYEVSPATSLQIRKTAAVGRTILAFWVAITFSVLTLLPFSYFMHIANKPFVKFVVPIATFFSLGVGSVVFLKSERNLRRHVERCVDRTVGLLEQEINDSFRRRVELSNTDLRRLQELRAIHKDLLDRGYYRSFAVSGISALIPFVGPIAAAIISHGTAISDGLTRIKPLIQHILH